MDCVKLPVSELTNEVYTGDYSVSEISDNSDINSCIRSCISTKGCKAWKYDPRGQCFISSNINGEIESAPGFVGGKVECQNEWSMVKLIWWIVIIGLILVLIWYVLNRCVPAAKSQGRRFLPRFYVS